jgi:hypothetical protein
MTKQKEIEFEKKIADLERKIDIIKPQNPLEGCKLNHYPTICPLPHYPYLQNPNNFNGCWECQQGLIHVHF